MGQPASIPLPSEPCGPSRSREDICPGIERVPEWEHYSWLRHGFSTRSGGRSSVYGPDVQNLGWTGEDAPEIVAANRSAFVQAAARGVPMQLVTLQQVHGDLVRDVDAEPVPLMSGNGKAQLLGDGLMTRTPGRLVGMITADCVPVLVADPRLRAVAAFHAGWRGTVTRVVEGGIAHMREHYGSRPEELCAAIGPSIGACCFEVGEEVRDRFADAFRYAPEVFVAGSGEPNFLSGSMARAHLDLQEANRRQLLDAGLLERNISILAECTACTRSPASERKYFSHRAEAGVTGRMLSVVGVVSTTS